MMMYSPPPTTTKIAILYICIGDYIIFWKDFFESCEKFFLPNLQKEYFVFTDAQTLIYSDTCSQIHQIHQENLLWPDNTLKRFEMFLSIQNKLKDFDFIFFMNANIEFLTRINEDFLPTEANQNFTFVEHPVFYKKHPNCFSYERRRKSLAFIPKGQGKYYVRGGVNGGKTKFYLHLIQTLAHNISIDENNNITAIWHDESHLNRYILDRKDFKVFDPSYCFPQDIKSMWSKNLPKPKILARNKERYFQANNSKFQTKHWFGNLKLKLFYRFASFKLKISWVFYSALDLLKNKK